MNNMNSVTKSCLNCGKKFFVRFSHADRVHNCSKECGYETKKKRHLIHVKCAGCEKEFSFTKSSRRQQDKYFCSKSCSGKANVKSKRSSEWKIGSDGYVYKNVGGKKVLQHRSVMEDKLGRKLMGDENVHHINGNKSDNRIDNLELWSHRQPKGQRIGDKLVAAKMLLEEHGYVVHEPLSGIVDGLLYGAVPPILN